MDVEYMYFGIIKNTLIYMLCNQHRGTQVFFLWNSYAYFCDGGGYCEADHPKKDERGNKFNGRI